MWKSAALERESMCKVEKCHFGNGMYGFCYIGGVGKGKCCFEKGNCGCVIMKDKIGEFYY